MTVDRRTGFRAVALLWVALGAALYLLSVRSGPEELAPDGQVVLGGCLDRWIDVDPPPTPVLAEDGCPAPPGRPGRVGLTLVDLRQWSPADPLPLDPDERARLELRVDACPGRWGATGCELRPCVVTLALRHDLSASLVWVDGHWRLSDPAGIDPPSAAQDDSWFYLEPGATRLPRRRRPLEHDDCSIFERVRELPEALCEDAAEVSLEWTLEELRPAEGERTFTAADLRGWLHAGVSGLDH